MFDIRTHCHFGRCAQIQYYFLKCFFFLFLWNCSYQNLDTCFLNIASYGFYFVLRFCPLVIITASNSIWNKCYIRRYYYYYYCCCPVFRLERRIRWPVETDKTLLVRLNNPTASSLVDNSSDTSTADNRYCLRPPSAV